MASIYYLYEDSLNTEQEIVNKYRDHGLEAKKLHFAAVKIQSLFRGYLVRKEIKRWNYLATLIQKTYRGWLVRYHLPDDLHEYYDKLNLQCYNHMATRIQALWRGYTVRKTICIAEIKKMRERIKAANAAVTKALQEQAKKNNVLRHKTNIEKILTVLFDRHHLLRTWQKEGVLSTHGSQELSALEKFLDFMEWKPYMDKLRDIYNTFKKEKEEDERIFGDKFSSKQDDKYCLRKAPRAKFEPDYGIHKQPFKLTNKVEDQPYDKMVGTIGKYTVALRDIVRVEDKSKNISHKDFNLYTLRQVANEADVPPYYIDIWFEKCRIHNLP